MSDKQKACTKCGAIKPLSEFRTKKRRTGYFPASECKACGSVRAKQYWERMGKPKQGWATIPFDQWTPEMREAHRKSKEASRRKAGMRSKTDIEKDREMLRQQREAEKAARAAQREAQRKVPAGLTEAEKFRWRYNNDPEFREKQKARTRRTKARAPYWYANQQLGGNSQLQYPPGLVFAKQMQLKIKRYIKEQNHEEH
jgi:hypothetical protein